MAKKRAFVRYTKKGKLVPGSLIVTTGGGHPVDGVYKEVPTDLCCVSSTSCIEPLILEVAPELNYYEFAFRVFNPNTVAGTIEWGDGTIDTFDLTGGSGFYYFDHNYSTPDEIPQTIKVFFTSITGFRNLEIGDAPWKTLSVSNIPTVFAGSTTIQQVDADGSLITSLNVSGLTSLEDLYAVSCPNLAYLNVQGCTGLTNTELNNCAFETLNFSGCSSLQYAELSGNVNLTNVIITGCPSINYLSLGVCDLTVSSVNTILTTLDTNGVLGGFVVLSGGTNAAPTGAGLTAKTSLLSKGWGVLTN